MAAWIPIIMAAASILGSAAQRRAQERANQQRANQDQANRDQQSTQSDNAVRLQAENLWRQSQNDRAQIGLQAPSTRTRQALLGSMLQHARSTRVTAPPGIRMGQVSGGLDIDSLINAAARGAGGTLQRQATTALETGSDVPIYTDPRAALRPSTTSAGYLRPGGLETGLSTASLLASIIAGIGQARGNGASTPNAVRPPQTPFPDEDI